MQKSTGRTIVYIDGENFLHRLEDSLRNAKIIKSKLEITKPSIRSLIEEIYKEYNNIEIRYYGTRIKSPSNLDHETQKHAQKMIDSQRRLKRNLEKQNILFITAGTLRLREATCRSCKKTTLVFKEKGVDVRLAVDLAEEASKESTQILLSSDSDLISSLKAARSKNSSVSYLYYAPSPNFALIKASTESRVFTDSQIKKVWSK